MKKILKYLMLFIVIVSLVLLAFPGSLFAVAAPEVWVDDDWNGLANSTSVGGGKVIGEDAFSTIQDAIGRVDSNGTVYVASGTHSRSHNIILRRGVNIKLNK